MTRSQHRQRNARTSGVARAWYRPWCVIALLTILPTRGPPAHAEDAWSASIAATSDYVLRGISQSYDHAALQAGVNYRSTFGAFAGAWSSNVNPYPFRSSALELDLYAGYAWRLTPAFSAQATYTRYTYLDNSRLRSYDYDELALGFKYLDRLALTWSWQPDASSYSSLGYAHHRSVQAGEISSLWPVYGGLTAMASVGYYDLHRMFGVGYAAGSAGIGWIGSHAEVELIRYVSQSTVKRLYGQASANGSVVVAATFRF
jgi:uncharacterized protein (TIGR02001 family)